MKLPEFRKQIETYSIEELRYLTAELYKAIPKKIKEEKDIDPLVLSVPEHFKENGTGKASSPSKVKKPRILEPWNQRLNFFLKMPMHRIILPQTASFQSMSGPNGVLR